MHDYIPETEIFSLFYEKKPTFSPMVVICFMVTFKDTFHWPHSNLSISPNFISFLCCFFLLLSSLYSPPSWLWVCLQDYPLSSIKESRVQGFRASLYISHIRTPGRFRTRKIVILINQLVNWIKCWLLHGSSNPDSTPLPSTSQVVMRITERHSLFSEGTSWTSQTSTRSAAFFLCIYKQQLPSSPRLWCTPPSCLVACKETTGIWHQNTPSR